VGFLFGLLLMFFFGSVVVLTTLRIAIAVGIDA